MHQLLLPNLAEFPKEFSIPPLIIVGSSFETEKILDINEVVGHSLKSKDDVLKRSPSNEEPFSSLAFKIMTDPYVGKLTFFRVYSGSLEAGQSVMNSVSGKKERIGRLLLMHADKREERKKVTAGEIAAAVGLKETKTGHTLCDPSNPIVLEQMDFQKPVISVAIEASSKAEQENLSESLAKLSDEDPTFQVSSDDDTGQTVISGMGELHLEILVDRLKREFNVNANVGKPQVAYRETISSNADVEGKFVRQSGGRGQYGHVKIKVKPNEPGKGYSFESKIVGGAIPKEYINPVSQGIEESLKNGILAGYPMEDISVELYDGTYHNVDSSEMAFKIAGSMAIKEGCKQAKPVLLEPVMKVEVVLPEQYLGDIMGDLTSRRSEIQGTEHRKDAVVISAVTPLSEMFGYATSLRSMSQGRAVFSMEFDKYKKAPKSVTENIVEKSGSASSE